MGKMTLQQMITQLAGGMAVSTQIFVITLLFSLPLGLVIAFGRMSKNKLIQTIVKVYISIMRGTPLMLQLMVVYFGPYYLFRIKVGSSYRLWATFIGFVINYAAYFAEIYRSGIQSMPAGQYFPVFTTKNYKIEESLLSQALTPVEALEFTMAQFETMFGENEALRHHIIEWYSASCQPSLFTTAPTKSLTALL